MSTSGLAKKLQIPEQGKVIVVRAPEDIGASINSDRPGIKTKWSSEADYVLLFVLNKNEADEHIPRVLSSASSNALIYVAYPKLSGALKSDINRDKGWETFDEAGYVGVRAISIDKDWSAIRWRPRNEVKTYTRMDKSKHAQARKNFKVTPMLTNALKGAKKEREFFESLSYSCKKEYSNYISEAKKEETRERRLSKVMAMLEVGKKTFY